jgi:TnpA family transposase
VELLNTLRSVKSQAYFVLQLGYFKAKHLFFVFDLHEVKDDLQHVLERHFDHRAVSDLGTIDKHTRLKQQRLIRQRLGYRGYDAVARRQLGSKARQAAKVSAKPIYIFRELLHYLTEHRIVAPGYSAMQDIVSQALTREQHRLIGLARRHLKPFDLEALNRLLADVEGLYDITQLKREPKDFSTGEIKREIHRGEQLRHLYWLAHALLPALEISNESIKYYASLVGYYSVHRLKQLNEWIVYIDLLCFAYHRYQRLHDTLIQCLIYNVRRYREEAKTAAKDRIYDLRVENNQNLKKAGQILKFFTGDQIDEEMPFEQVQRQAFAILDRPTLDFVADHIATTAYFDEAAFQWEQIDQLSRPFKLNLRPIVQTSEFAAISAHAPLIEAIQFLKTAFRKGKPLGQHRTDDFPVRFIPKAMSRYLYAPASAGLKAQPLPDRYEFAVYRLLSHGLDAGDIFCRDSVRFRSFEDDLVDNERWQNKDQLLNDIGLSLLKQPIREHLAELKQQLETRISEVNRRIDSGENKHFKIKKRGKQTRWSLPYPRSNESVNHPFFDSLAPVDIGSVLHYVDQQCHFMNAFEHVLGRYAKQGSDHRLIIAGLIAWATNMGLGRMGEVSDIPYHQLARTSENFIRLETLRAANDEISNATAELAIFQHYDIGDRLHSSTDGQKFETQIDTINARHSSKYFGLKKGVVSYSLVDNHIPINAQIIGANEHESHYVFDILFNNTTDIQPEVHSTDTHGTNQVNFALLHLFGYQFAPRYKDIYTTVKEGLYGFQHPSQYGDALIKPIRKANEDLIVDEWDNIQRIIVSLALKTTTQSIIVGKLSAHSRKNRTRRALWEYNNLIKSLYLLEYIDSPPLRQNVQRALNRGESYHKLRRAVSYANFGKLRFKTEQEQQIWGECARLITNAIIYYNASILSHLLAYRQSIGDLEGIAQLKQVSPVAWQHVNLHGRFQFSDQPQLINMESIIRTLAQIPIDSEQMISV